MAPRAYLISAVIVAVVAFQLLVPTIALLAHRPARFGWQMYSAMPDLPHVWLVDRSGAESAVELSHYFSVQRAEVDYRKAILDGLCAVTDAAGVRIEDHGASQAVTCP